MKQLCFILFFVLGFLGVNLSAQDIVIIGQVLSSEDATPLEFAQVKFKGTDIVTFTNDQGFFLIRSPQHQRKITISIVGYRTKNIKLEKGKDQMLEIFLDEDIAHLDEIIIIPGENPAFEILRRVDKNRDRNNPSYISNIEFQKYKYTDLCLTNIKQKAYQRKLFKEMMNGVISKEDSTYILPLLMKEELSANKLRVDKSIFDTIFNRQNTVEILSNDHWNAFLDTYTPNVNFYDTYIPFLNKAILSPIASQGRSFYKYYLKDSVTTNGIQNYIINFSPKGGNLPLLKGTMSINSQTYALTYIKANLDQSANINFVNEFNVEHRYVDVDSNAYSQNIDTSFTLPRSYYSLTTHNIGLNMSIIPDDKNIFWGAMLSERIKYDNIVSVDTGFNYLPKSYYISKPIEEDKKDMWKKITNLNQSKLKHFVNWAIDIGINQYLHIWKIDMGPVLNMFRYNSLEGASPRLALRSGEKFSKNFTFGGYFGYGFNDHQYKYGGQVQWRLGNGRRNYISVLYDRKVYNYGYEDPVMYNENKVEEKHHLINSLYRLIFNTTDPTYAGLRSNITLSYKYEKKGFKFWTDVLASKTFSNAYMPFVHNGQLMDSYEQLSLKLGCRASWQERSLDYFFNRYYLSSDMPVFKALTEVGLVKVEQNLNPYIKLTLLLKQQIPFVLGKFSYQLEAAGVLGKVPYPMLIIPRVSQESYFSKHSYILMNEFEFLNDVLVGARLQYQTPGFMFGYIPGVKKLGIRENFIFNIAYGALLQKHDQVMALPGHSKEFGNMPYMECGVGFSNILRILSVDSIWRLTHRDTPGATKWAICFRLDLDF